MSKVLLGVGVTLTTKPRRRRRQRSSAWRADARRRSSPYRDDVPADLTYSVRRSPRARRVRVTVDPHAGIEVVLPARAPARAAAAAIAELRPWIERRLAEAETVRAHVRARGDTVPYLGADLRLVAQPGRSRAHRRGDALLVPAGATQTEAIERWYRRAARTEIAPRADRAAHAIGRPYRALTIRGQRTRWGSRSATITSAIRRSRACVTTASTSMPPGARASSAGASRTSTTATSARSPCSARAWCPTATTRCPGRPSPTSTRST